MRTHNYSQRHFGCFIAIIGLGQKMIFNVKRFSVCIWCSLFVAAAVGRFFSSLKLFYSFISICCIPQRLHTNAIYLCLAPSVCLLDFYSVAVAAAIDVGFSFSRLFIVILIGIFSLVCSYRFLGVSLVVGFFFFVDWFNVAAHKILTIVARAYVKILRATERTSNG